MLRVLLVQLLGRRRSTAQDDLLRALRDREQLKPLIVHPQIELPVTFETQIFVVSVALQSDGNFVGAIDLEAPYVPE